MILAGKIFSHVPCLSLKVFGACFLFCEGVGPHHVRRTTFTCDGTFFMLFVIIPKGDVDVLETFCSRSASNCITRSFVIFMMDVGRQ